ncbi:type VII secretion integral membrane protein EccD [Micromonospora sp. NPDC049559]|uniref:type VII secretion integral membrane protein EccD n=1 Tax=Micromonospora sp. NPDC049559 TaxID=3155923 RepID=UPI003434A640
MTVTAPAEMCRLVVCGPDSQLEIAVPARVVVADLLPVLLRQLGDGMADAGLGHDGWVLQRLGGPPLDEEATIGSCGLTDGTVVHLRPRADRIPPVHFDDLADGLATGVRDRPGLWRPEMVRWAAAGTLALALGAGLVALAGTGPTLARAVVAGAVALLLAAAGPIFTRSFGDRLFGLVAAAGAAGYGALAGLVAPDAATPTSRLVLGAPQLFTAAVIVAVLAVPVGVLVGRAGPATAAVVSGALVTATGAALATFAGVDGAGAGGVVAVSATVLTAAVPVTAFRLARIRLAPLPTRPEHLQEDIDPEPSEELLGRAAAADRYMTGLHVGLGLAAGVGLVLCALGGGWAGYTLAGLTALVRLLAARPMTSGWHRLAGAAPAAAGLVAVALLALRGAEPPVRLAAVPAALAILVVLLFLAARHLPGRRLMPVWGRIGDVTQLVATVALLPVLAAVLDLYGAARALGG